MGFSIFAMEAGNFLWQGRSRARCAQILQLDVARTRANGAVFGVGWGTAAGAEVLDILEMRQRI
jgi:hypothetical protein